MLLQLRCDVASGALSELKAATAGGGLNHVYLCSHSDTFPVDERCVKPGWDLRIYFHNFLQATEQGVHFFHRIIESEGRSRSAGDAEVTHQRLRTVMATSDRDSLLVEQGA